MKLELVCKEIFIEDAGKNMYGLIPSDFISLYVNGERYKLDKCIKLKSNTPIKYTSKTEFIGYGQSSIRTFYCELDIEKFEIERFILVFANLSLNDKIYECDCLYSYKYKTDNGMIPLDFNL